MEVQVRDNNVDQALRALKKKMQREGLFREMRTRRHNEKPSEKSAREKAEAIRRSRKLARKRRNATKSEGCGPTTNRARTKGDRRSGAAGLASDRRTRHCAYWTFLRSRARAVVCRSELIPDSTASDFPDQLSIGVAMASRRIRRRGRISM